MKVSIQRKISDASKTSFVTLGIIINLIRLN
jgi:hypothetical protein